MKGGAKNTTVFHGLTGVAVFDDWERHYKELATIARGLGGSSLPLASRRALGLCVLLEESREEVARLRSLIAGQSEAQSVERSQVETAVHNNEVLQREVADLKGQLKSAKMQLGKAKKKAAEVGDEEGN